MRSRQKILAIASNPGDVGHRIAITSNTDLHPLLSQDAVCTEQGLEF